MTISRSTPDEQRAGDQRVLPWSRRPLNGLLCQFPDMRCDKEQHMGTDYCASHIDLMRERAGHEIDPSDYTADVVAIEEEEAA